MFREVETICKDTEGMKRNQIEIMELKKNTMVEIEDLLEGIDNIFEEGEEGINNQ